MDVQVAEEELLPLSALQHLRFCERQCVLIHLERQWADNVPTLEGTLLHRRVDSQGPRLESRGDLRIARGLALRSLRLGLVGIGDVVELHRDAAGASIKGLRARWRPFPVEHKRGRPKDHDADRVQLCAQALCLEEMLGTEVPKGALFYGQTHRREEVDLDAGLRRTTEEAAARLHQLLATGITPRAVREPKCRRCSLLEICMPDAMAPARSVKEYLASLALGEGT